MSFLDNNPLSFIFGTKPGAGVPTYEQLQMRRKIAESLLGQRSKYPKTFGEGLSAIGEAIGERGMMSRLDAMEAAKGAQDTTSFNDAMGTPSGVPPVARPMSYAPEDSGTGTVAAAATTGANVGKWNQFAQEQSPGGLGLTPAQAAGLVGNLQAESGANINPNAPPGDNGTAFGSAQWRGPRLAALQQYAVRQGLNPMTTEAQQGFMRQEMIGQGNRTPTEGGAYSALTATNTPAGAATAVDRLYERSSGEHRDRRINNAQKIMNMPVGPQSSVIDPGLNQSVALDQTAPPAPSGPPTAFSGQPANDAPPVGAPPDARMAITNALAPKPPPVVAPPVPPTPAPVQIAQAPPQQQIRTAPPTEIPPAQANDTMRKIEKALTTIGDPMQRDVLIKRYNQEWANQQELYKQRLEAPKRAVDLAKVQEELKKLQEESQTRVQEKQIEMAKKAQDFQQSQIASAPTSMITGTPKVAGVSNVALQGSNDPRLGTPESPQRSGVPNIGPPPTGISPQKWNEVQAPIMAKATDTYEKAIPKMQELLDTIKTANEHPGRAWGVGSGSNIAKSIPGTSAYGFGKLMEQVAGKNFLEAYQILKGGGQITEIEGTKAEAAQARLNTAQSKEDFDKSMIDFENAVRNDMERVQRKMNVPVTAWRPPGDNTSTAPDKGQIGSRKGKLVEYIGGNPALDESYKAVQ